MPLRPASCSVFLLLLLSACGTAPKHPVAEKPTANLPPSGFTLLPKSFQKNPMLDMVVFTELTPLGRKHAPPTAENPVYYVAQPGGFRQQGANVAGEIPPPSGHMDYFVRRALAAGGYRPVPSPEVRPALFISYHWGTHNSLQGQMSEDFPLAADADVLDRARMVGGLQLVKEIDRQKEFGETILDEHDEKMRYLKDQAVNSCYFVVLYAYEYDAMVRGERHLCWRTSMTVGASGVSVRETLPPLIASSAPFLGRETPDPAITSRTLRGREKIEIGPLITLENGEAVPASEVPRTTR